MEYEVNQLLAGKSGENSFEYIVPHNNINTILHLNRRDGFYLKRKGIYQISYNFKDYFNNG